jgi:hypothetical protein
MTTPWFTIATYLLGERNAEDRRRSRRASIRRFLPQWRSSQRDDQAIVKMFEVAGIPYDRTDEAWCLAFAGA